MFRRDALIRVVEAVGLPLTLQPQQRPRPPRINVLLPYSRGFIAAGEAGAVRVYEYAGEDVACKALHCCYTPLASYLCACNAGGSL